MKKLVEEAVRQFKNSENDLLDKEWDNMYFEACNTTTRLVRYVIYQDLSNEDLLRFLLYLTKQQDQAIEKRLRNLNTMKIIQQPISIIHNSAMFFNGLIATKPRFELRTFQDGEIRFMGNVHIGTEIIELGKTGLINDDDINNNYCINFKIALKHRLLATKHRKLYIVGQTI